MVEASWLSEASADLDSTNNVRTIAATTATVVAATTNAVEVDCFVRLANVQVVWAAAVTKVAGNEVFSADCKRRC